MDGIPSPPGGGHAHARRGAERHVRGGGGGGAPVLHFVATRRPSASTARCTWPIEAAAAGVLSKDASWSRQPSPGSR